MKTGMSSALFCVVPILFCAHVWCPDLLLLLSLLLLQALQLAQAALEGSDTDRLRSVSLGLLGRCHHALGDLAAAQHHYAQVGAYIVAMAGTHSGRRGTNAESNRKEVRCGARVLGCTHGSAVGRGCRHAPAALSECCWVAAAC
jgi:hypothetical protein